MLGSAFGHGAHALLPHLTAPSGAYALVGMGALFAGAARAPMTAVIIVFELTGEYSVILPLMLAIVMATAISGALAKDTIYTLKLRRRGIQIGGGKPVNIMRAVPVAAAMEPMPPTIPAATPLSELLACFADNNQASFPIVHEDELVGVISAMDIESRALNNNDREPTAAELAHAVPELRADANLEDAAKTLGQSDDAGLPVVAADGGGIVGWVSHRDVLLAYQQERERRAGAPAARPPGAVEALPSVAAADGRINGFANRPRGVC
jgi:CIC family chloride channel protein